MQQMRLQAQEHTRPTQIVHEDLDMRTKDL